VAGNGIGRFVAAKPAMTWSQNDRDDQRQDARRFVDDRATADIDQAMAESANNG
jgi:hypothetical protein